jgi:hypothetical protein
MTRPVRLAIVFAPSLDTLRLAVDQATTLWAGIYQPFLAGCDAKTLRWTAGRMGVDVVHALDGALAAIPPGELEGYSWRGSGEWSPLGPARDFSNSRLLGPEIFADQWPVERSVMPSWQLDDPLDPLFRLWFGSYADDSAQAANLRQAFVVRSTNVAIPAAGTVPDSVTSWFTPIHATGVEIDYTGESSGPAIVVVDPSDASSLMTYWNARALGANVFPWPVSYESRVLPAAQRWLDELKTSDQLHRWRSGDGKLLGARIEVLCRDDRRRADDRPVPLEPMALPDSLSEFLGGNGVESMAYPSESLLEIHRGWRGAHPFETRFSEIFSQPVENDGAIVVQVPRLPADQGRQSVVRGDVVATHVTFETVSELRPDWTFAVPNIRGLASFIGPYDGTLLQFDRPTSDGRVLSTSQNDRNVRVSAVPSDGIFGKLIAADGWRSDQTPGGVFVTRLIERLGGVGSTIANQPGARAGLIEVARSPRGRTSGAVVQRIMQRKGSWPNPLVPVHRRSDYAAGVFRYLLSRGILRPVLPISCPHCTTSTSVRPEDLQTVMKCDLCLHEYPLGLALGIRTSGRNEWLYQLASHVDQSRLSEALAVMAVMEVLTAAWHSSSSIVPHLLGWKVNGPDLDCEVDVAAVRHERGMPIVVVGEVKYHKDSISSRDLENLAKLQDHLRSRDIESFVLIAVLRELRSEEVEIMREFASAPKETLADRSHAILPIVLTEADLSVHRFDDHPMRWGTPGGGLADLAKESCSRHLGLVDVNVARDGDSWRYQSVWR